MQEYKVLIFVLLPSTNCKVTIPSLPQSLQGVISREFLHFLQILHCCESMLYFHLDHPSKLSVGVCKELALLEKYNYIHTDPRWTLPHNLNFTFYTSPETEYRRKMQSKYAIPFSGFLWWLLALKLFVPLHQKRSKSLVHSFFLSICQKGGLYVV